jgi:hypothetical protein
MAGVLTEIRNENLPNASLGRYRYIKLLSRGMGGSGVKAPPYIIKGR